MNEKATPGGQICPRCGAANKPLSIFCAECGTSLEGSDTNNDDENVGQTTVSFTPVNDHGAAAPAAWDPPVDTQTTQLFTPQRPEMAATGESAAASWTPNEEYSTSYMQRPPESRRGFVLGLIAAMLIIIVICFFIWSSVVSESFRDSVIGFF